MKSENLISHFTKFATSRNVDRPTVIEMLEDVFRTLIEKQYGHAEHFDIIINPEKGDLQILRNRRIVADDAPDLGEMDTIALSEAHYVELMAVGMTLLSSLRQTMTRLWPSGAWRLSAPTMKPNGQNAVTVR